MKNVVPKNIVLGITGSIAAYKAADIANTLTKEGVAVHAVMTRAAQHFITPLTLQTLTGRKVSTDMFAEMGNEDVRHISLAKNADAVLIAPATANIIAKIAAGIADDYLSTVVLAAWQKPLFIAPAMNTAMWENPITRANIETLKTRGAFFIEPRQARLACGDLGKGAMADVSEIVRIVREAL
ncbi:MAG: phosphopantothenoylcysteine decarboxylase [Spirochaetaceae bacterium]|nr:phosphopantothenoylcysteine decarboxylase [Spirochaetaceae bacterium]